MKKYKLSDGGIITASSDLEIVSGMKEDSKFCSHESISEFMEGFSKRYKMVYGEKLPYDSVERFVKSLSEVGYLVEIAQ